MISRLVTTFAVAVVVLASADAAVASDPPGFPAANTSMATLLLTDYGPSVLTATDMLTVGATVSNPTALGETDLTVSLAVTTEPLPTSSSLERFLEDPTLTETRVATSVMISALAPSGVSKVSLSAGAASLGLPARTSGVYGVVIVVRNAVGIAASQTAALTWYDAPITPLHVALIATASGSAERAQQVFAAASATEVALVVDPVALTDAAQADAIAVGHEVFGLPSGDPDLTSVAHSDDRSLIDFALADAKNNAQSALQNLPWLATIPVVDDQTIALAASKGAVAGLLDVTEGATIAATTPVADVQAGSATLPVLVPDRDLSDILATYRPGMPDAAARLVAEAFLVAEQGDGSTPVVVAPGSAWRVSEFGASASVTDLLSAPWVRPVTVRSVLEGSHRSAVEAPSLEGADADLSPDLIRALARQLIDVEQLSKTVEDPDAIYLPGGRTLLEPLAVTLREDADARIVTYQDARDRVNRMLGSLHVAAGSDVNLIAASGNVPVTLHNDLNVDATVTVVMRSSSPNLVVEDRPVVTIPAGTDLTVHIPVTGVKSANVTTTVALENGQGEVVAAPQAVRVRVRADWGNAITVVFAVGLALLLIAGLVRTIRRGRGTSRMAPMPPSRPSEDTDAGGGDG